jgi:signal transduction histidine kinase
MKRNLTYGFSLLLKIVFVTSLYAQKGDTLTKITAVRYGNNQVGFDMNNLDISQNKVPKLSFDQNYLQFSFINKKNPQNKTFYYYLVGLDYTWIKCEDCSQSQYAHLNGGNYTFRVKTVEKDDIPSEFKFFVEGDILHKWWFVPMLLMYVLAFLGIGVYFFALFRFRQKLIQQRLIHRERMKSMSELTAGIAHEMQNPLNFVTNFSGMSLELVQELNDEMQKPNFDRELIRELVDNILQNQQKIYQHGQRASGIVNGMLEHSKVNIGQFQLTDINKLIEQQLKLAESVFKNSHKDFVVESQFQENNQLPKLNVIPQEIGKVLQNIFSNAFYAMTKTANPILKVSTQKSQNQVIIKINDTGTGMSESVRGKIFQPFFTTKSTGEGTGLGLSLAYDIVTKGHGGTIECESVEGEGTTFIVKLTIS